MGYLPWVVPTTPEWLGDASGKLQSNTAAPSVPAVPSTHPRKQPGEPPSAEMSSRRRRSHPRTTFRAPVASRTPFKIQVRASTLLVLKSPPGCPPSSGVTPKNSKILIRDRETSPFILFPFLVIAMHIILGVHPAHPRLRSWKDSQSTPSIASKCTIPL